MSWQQASSSSSSSSSRRSLVRLLLWACVLGLDWRRCVLAGDDDHDDHDDHDDNEEEENAFWLSQHAFMAPSITDNPSSTQQRSPCPGLNTLANHGFLHRHGANITLKSIVEAGQAVFGIDQAMLTEMLFSGLSLGFSAKRIITTTWNDTFMAAAEEEEINGTNSSSNKNSNGELALDLFDFYQDNVFETPGRMFRQNDDHNDNKFALFNQSMLDDFIATYQNEDGMVSWSDLLDYRSSRIRQARKRTPPGAVGVLESSGFHNNQNADGQARYVTFHLLALAAFAAQDDNFVQQQQQQQQQIRTDYLRSLFQDNRLPDGYLPRQDRGLSIVSQTNPAIQAVAQEIHGKIQAALQSPLKSDDTNVDDNDDDDDVTTYLVIAIIILAVTLGLLVLYYYYYFFSTCRAHEKSPTQDLEESSVSESAVEVSLEGNNKCLSKDISNRSTTSLSDCNEVDDNEGDGDNDDDDKGGCDGGQAMNLSWVKLTVKVKLGGGGGGNQGKGKTDVILSNVSGSAPSGQVTGIIGPSGAGKSLLLRILGGRHAVIMGNKSTLEGSVQINGQDMSQQDLLLNKHCGVAFVGQDDSFLNCVTPREAIRFTARLRLPRNVTEDHIRNLTADILKDLRLGRVQDRVISDKWGLSGGEKRRVSLGLELVTRPHILLLDEITSGLDSHSACVVMKICRHIARKRSAAVAMVVHQPNSVILSMMDRLNIMQQGGCLYEGLRANVETYFADRGFAVPSNYNVADWVLEVSQENSSSKLQKCGFYEDPTGDANNAMIPALPKEEGDKFDDQHPERVAEARVSFVTEVRELVHRELLILIRDPPSRLYDIAMIMSMTLVVSLVFQGVGKDFLENVEKFTSNVGVVYSVTSGGMIMTMIAITNSANNRLRFCREYTSGHYRLLSYGLVMMTFEIAFIFVCGIVFTLPVFYISHLNGDSTAFFLVITFYGAVSSAMGFAFTSLFEVASIAQTQVPLVVAPQFLFSGFLVTYQILAPWIRWVVWLQPLTYAFRLMLNKEFAVCQDFSTDERLVLNCAKSVEAGLSQLYSRNVEEIFDDESDLTVVQVGNFIGGPAILEYFSYFSVEQDPLSILWDYCTLEGPAPITINKVGDGFCDVTLANVNEARVNANILVSPPDENDNRRINFVQGSRLNIVYPEDLSRITIKKANVFFPPNFADILFLDASPTALAASVCLVQNQYCASQDEQNGFMDLFSCFDQLETLPRTTVSDAGVNTLDGNSTGCRHVHAAMAALNPNLHCPHISYSPMLDPKNKTKCSNSSNYEFKAFFSDGDLLLFQQTAQLHGLDMDTLVNQTVPGRTCTARSMVYDSIDSIPGMPAHMFCYSYLETQKATHEDGLITTYWLALMGFLVFYSVGGLLLLRRRALYARHEY